MLVSTILIFSLIIGLSQTTPINDDRGNGKLSKDILLEQAFRQAHIVLNRYYHVMKSDTDHLVHAMLYLIMNNPTSFPFIPHRALDIALKNVAKTLGQDDVEILTKPILLSIEQNAQNKAKQSLTMPLSDEVKDKIENALDKYFEEQE